MAIKFTAKSQNNHMALPHHQLQRFLKKMAVACALAFKRGSYEEAERLMRRLEHPERTNIMFWSEPATVSLSVATSLGSIPRLVGHCDES